MFEEQVECLGIQSVSDFVWVFVEQQEVEFGSIYLFVMDLEFVGCFDGFGFMSELYVLYFICNDICQMDVGLVYIVLKNCQVFFGFVYIIDGCLKDFKLCVLKDDKQYFFFYNVVLVVCKEVMQCYLEFVMLFDLIIEWFDDVIMQVFNVWVDIEQQMLQKVVVDFFCEYYLFDDGQVGQGGSQ